MPGSECVELLQWALPRIGLRWLGFRRVRRQVCRRIGRRIQELHLPNPSAYRAYLESHPEEWRILDTFCRVSISRFARDGPVFDRLGREVLPALASAVLTRDDRTLRCWSAGCGSGEEPYSVNILWHVEVKPRFPSVELSVLGTDIDPQLIQRARLGEYQKSSLREVSPVWLESAFEQSGGVFVVRPAFRAGIEFRCEDLREELPREQFDLVLCRNLALTYFDEALQRKTLKRLLSVLRSGGALIIGIDEQLPADTRGVAPWVPELGINRKTRARASSETPGAGRNKAERVLYTSLAVDAANHGSFLWTS